MAESFQEFLKKLKYNFDSYMPHLENKKLSTTNNAMENLLRTIFPRQIKKNYLKLLKELKYFYLYMLNNGTIK
ncbi:MAG: hypothetical protein LBB45_02550 [Methanobrevibacter sp.]|jgi:hypothetical protein|nr:hypothetical protein [Candidatus Methanovirga basalitermitum]